MMRCGHHLARTTKAKLGFTVDLVGNLAGSTVALCPPWPCVHRGPVSTVGLSPPAGALSAEQTTSW